MIQKVHVIYDGMRTGQAELSKLHLLAHKFHATADGHSQALADYATVRRFDKVVSFLSIVWSLSGFVFWYLKIQQYQDIILMHQAIPK